MLVAYAGSSWTVLRKAKAMSRPRARRLEPGGPRVPFSNVRNLDGGDGARHSGFRSGVRPRRSVLHSHYLLIFSGFLLLPDNETGRTQRTRVLLDSVDRGACHRGLHVDTGAGRSPERVCGDDRLESVDGDGLPDPRRGHVGAGSDRRYPPHRIPFRSPHAAIRTRCSGPGTGRHLVLAVRGRYDVRRSRTQLPGVPVCRALFFSAAIILDRQPVARAYADRNANVWAMVAPYTAALAWWFSC